MSPPFNEPNRAPPTNFFSQAKTESEKSFFEIIESIEDGYFEVDLAGNLTAFNRPLCETLGYRRSELIGMNNREFMDPSNAKLVYQTFNQVYWTGVSAKALDWELIGKDGRKHYVESSISLKRDGGGSPIGFFGIARDVTGKKLAARALKESKERYRSFLESSPDPIVIYDNQGKATYINLVFEKTFGWSRDELLGGQIDFVPQDQRPRTLQAIGRVRKGESVHLFETKRFTQDGNLLDVQLSASVHRDSEGNPDGIIVILRDISKLKIAQRALRDSEDRFGILVEESPYGIAIVEKSGKYKYLNPKFIEMFGYNLGDIPNGRTWFRKAYPDSAYRRQVIATWIAEHEKFVPGESKIYKNAVTCKDGTIKTILFKPVTIENGEVFISYEDVTVHERFERELKKAHNEMVSAYEELNMLHLARERVINHLSHELKTPIALLSGFFRLLNREIDKKDIRGLEAMMGRGERALQRLKKIQEETEDIFYVRQNGGNHQAGDLVDDLLGIREEFMECEQPPAKFYDLIIDKLVSMYGYDEGKNEDIQLDAFLNDICEEALQSVRTRHMEIIRDLPTGLKTFSNKRVLKKICRGLLRNAIENTPDEGQIEVFIRKQNDSVQIFFRDFGTGILPDCQRYIFYGFYPTQAGGQYSSKEPYEFGAGGSGADLLRTKIFSERYGFTVDFESTRCKYISKEENVCPGKISNCRYVDDKRNCYSSGGSTFVLGLPMADD